VRGVVGGCDGQQRNAAVSEPLKGKWQALGGAGSAESRSGVCSGEEVVC